MTLTGTHCIEHIEHVLNGPIDEIDSLQVINTAGHALVSMRDWYWLRGAVASLDFVAGQAYVALPSDFKAVKAIEHAGTISGFSWGSADDILTLRARSNTGGSHYFGVIVWAREISSDGTETFGPPTPRLELWPEPTAAATAAFTLYYERKWAEITEEGLEVVLPDFMVPTYLEVLRAFAQGYEEPKKGSSSARLAEIMAGPIYGGAVHQDVRVRPKVGKLHSGIGDDAGGSYRNWSGAITGPA